MINDRPLLDVGDQIRLLKEALKSARARIRMLREQSKHYFDLFMHFREENRDLRHQLCTLQYRLDQVVAERDVLRQHPPQQLQFEQQFEQQFEHQRAAMEAFMQHRGHPAQQVQQYMQQQNVCSQLGAQNQLNSLGGIIHDFCNCVPARHDMFGITRHPNDL